MSEHNPSMKSKELSVGFSDRIVSRHQQYSALEVPVALLWWLKLCCCITMTSLIIALPILWHGWAQLRVESCLEHGGLMLPIQTNRVKGQNWPKIQSACRAWWIMRTWGCSCCQICAYNVLSIGYEHLDVYKWALFLNSYNLHNFFPHVVMIRCCVKLWGIPVIHCIL